MACLATDQATTSGRFGTKGDVVVRKPVNFVTYLALAIVTFGIYPLYFERRRVERGLQMCGRIAVVALPLLLAAVTYAEAQDIAELGRLDYERSKQLSMQPSTPADDTASLDSLTNKRDYTGYMVHLGLYGAINPSIYPSKTWINIACISTPGKSYRGFSLVYVDVNLYNGTRRVWNSSVRNRDRGICDINNGVDTTFVEVPRGLRFTSWNVFITPAEQRRRRVNYTTTIYPVKLY